MKRFSILYTNNLTFARALSVKDETEEENKKLELLAKVTSNVN